MTHVLLRTSKRTSPTQPEPPHLSALYQAAFPILRHLFSFFSPTSFSICTQPKTPRRHPYTWLPSKHIALHIPQLYLPVKIDSSRLQTTHSTQPFQPSESPSPGPLNYSSALRSSSRSSSTATISPHDFQSSTTDNSQSWLTQPPSQEPTSASPSNPGLHHQQDFVLYPQATTASRPARRQTELAPETSRTALSQSPASLQYERHRNRHSSSLQLQPVAPYQSSSVRNAIQGFGPDALSTSLQRSSPTGKSQSHLHLYSPSQSTINHKQRPPVPLFTSRNIIGSRNRTGPATMSRDHPTGIYPDAPVTTTTRKLIDERLDLNDLFEHLENDNSMEEDFSMFGATDMDYSTSSSFQPINDPASVQPSSDSVQTVSPQDIFSDNMSAPASGALTNMTTPGSSYQPSPYEYQKSSFMVTSTEQSPYLDADIETTSDWPTLFPEDEGIISTEQSIVDDTMAPPMSRNQSSPGQASSRSSHQGRHSSISGVNARKRDKPLPPIEIKDPHDIIQVKRARNTAAARKSRAKKMERFEDLQAEIDTLKQEVDYWKNMAEAGDRDS